MLRRLFIATAVIAMVAFSVIWYRRCRGDRAAESELRGNTHDAGKLQQRALVRLQPRRSCGHQVRG